MYSHQLPRTKDYIAGILERANKDSELKTIIEANYQKIGYKLILVQNLLGGSQEILNRLISKLEERHQFDFGFIFCNMHLFPHMDEKSFFGLVVRDKTLK
jgi:hypothetical protein